MVAVAGLDRLPAPCRGGVGGGGLQQANPRPLTPPAPRQFGQRPPPPGPLPSRGRGGLLALCLLAFAAPAAADVVSAAPERVAVTVYRDRPMTAAQLRDQGDDDTSGLAMISETRTLELPAGRSRIRFEGVADGIIPASAAVNGLPGALVERNFDYDLLDPGALIEKSVGGPVTIRRRDRKTGRATEEPATLRSGPDGLVVETSRGVEALGCGGELQALVFDHLPEGLADKPTLSVIADARRAGRYQVTLSYLTVRVDWSADYVARVAPDGRTLDLTGWLTLSNRSGMSFPDAETAVVAGRLARVAPDLPDIAPKQRADECWPQGTTSDFRRAEDEANMPRGLAGLMAPAPPPPADATSVTEMVVTAEKRQAVAGELGDYKLYSLVDPTTVAARQVKQVRFLHQPGVKFEKLYVWRADPFPSRDDDPSPAAAAVVLSLENKSADGLGLALPAGMVSVRQAQGGDEYFIGEHGVRDVPVGEPFELEIGQASDVTVTQTLASDATIGSGPARRFRLRVSYALTNAGGAPATVEVRQDPQREGFRVVAESARHVLKNGADVWRVVVPANRTATLTYSFEASE